MNDTVERIAPPPAPTSLSVNLVMTDEIRKVIESGSSYLAVAQAYEISDADTAQLAANELTAVKGALEKAEEWLERFIAPAKQSIATSREFFGPGIDGYKKSEALLKQRLLDWKNAEAERIRIANKKAEDEARVLRQKAEAEAAAETARANEKARQEREKAEQAERDRVAAEAAGNASAAAKAAAAAAKHQERAQAAVETGAARAQGALLTAGSIVAAVAPEAAVKIAGFSTRENWIAECAPGVDAETAKALIIAGIVLPPDVLEQTPPSEVVKRFARSDLLCCVAIDWKALGRLAKAQKSAMRVPGIRSRDNPIGAGKKG